MANYAYRCRCGHRLTLRDDYLGKIGTCTSCKCRIRITSELLGSLPKIVRAASQDVTPSSTGRAAEERFASTGADECSSSPRSSACTGSCYPSATEANIADGTDVPCPGDVHQTGGAPAPDTQDEEHHTHTGGQRNAATIAHVLVISSLVLTPLVFAELKRLQMTVYGIYALGCLIFGISVLGDLTRFFAKMRLDDEEYGRLLHRRGIFAPAQGFRAALGGALGGLLGGLPGGLIVSWLGGGAIVGTILGIVSASDERVVIRKATNTKFSFKLWLAYKVALIFKGLMLGLTLGQGVVEWVFVWGLLGAFEGFIVGYFSGLQGRRIPILWG